MAQSLANFDNALKNVYGPGMRNALNNSNPVLTEVVRDTEHVEGRKCIWNVHTGRSSGVGARKEGVALPTPDRQRTIAPEDTLAYEYATVEVTGQALHLTQNKDAAFAKALEFEMTNIVKDQKVDLARQMYNKAVTINGALANGALARSAGAPSANVITLEDLSSTTGGTADPVVFRYFEEGMLIDAVDASTGAITEAAMVVTAIDPAAGTITVDDDGATADDNYLFRAGNYDAGENEINGLPFLLGTQNYAGVTVSTNPKWAGKQVGSSTSGISENLLMAGTEEVVVSGSGEAPDLGLIAYKQGRKLASLLQTQKRYEPAPLTLTAGWEGIKVAGLDLVFDRFAPERAVYLVKRSELAWFVGLDWDWDTDGGTSVLTKVPGFDKITGDYKAYVNLQTYTRNSHATITLADPTF